MRTSGEFFVHSRDVPGSGAALDALAPRHWDYMDGFADRLVARGPTLSDDGEEHTGSVHVVTAADLDEARRFAGQEPFQRAGLYGETCVVRFANLLGRSMWERPPATAPPRSTLAVARWPATVVDAEALRTAREAARAQPDVWVFLGSLVDEDGGCVGVAAALDEAPAEAERHARAVTAALGHGDAPLELQRWRRGGRPQRSR